MAKSRWQKMVKQFKRARLSDKSLSSEKIFSSVCTENHLDINDAQELLDKCKNLPEWWNS